MAKTIEAQIGDETLALTTGGSDRFVYSNYFVPLLLTFDDDKTPLLSFYVKQQLAELRNYGIVAPDRIARSLQTLGFDELWQKNRMFDALESIAVIPAWLAGDPNRVAHVEPPGVRQSVLKPEDQTVDFIAGLLQSEIGVVFLDRTRIRPVGLDATEPAFSLGLGPGETVVLEQKTFTKREVTFEEQNEQEKQFDLELASTYSTELQEGFERQRALTDTWGLNVNQNTQYTSPQEPWGQINAAYTINYAKSVTDASQETARRSVKDNQTASSKVAARYRTQHKTTFRVATEQSFEASSKRTIQNPNRTTPISLIFFKVHQRLQMTQERYGVRLCWAPSVKDPAQTFIDKIRAGKQQILDAAEKSLPAKPQEPTAPPSGGGQATTTRETKVFRSDITIADHWNLWGGMSWDYPVDIKCDDGYTWDGDAVGVEGTITVFSKRPQVSQWLVGTPVSVHDEQGSRLRVTVHIGTGEWLGGPGISFQVGATFYKDVTITDQAAKDTKYADDLESYRVALKEWADACAAIRTAAQAAANDYETRMLTNLDPMKEMIGQIIEAHFPASVRDECWEIEYWQRLFDWERASFFAYPGWWSDDAMRAPMLTPSDFLNASWAKLYLPVRLGMELFALRWIVGKTMAGKLSDEIEGRLQMVIDDLKKYRENTLGSIDELPALAARDQKVEEKIYPLAQWVDLVPTDGTHLEVVLSATSAADPITSKEIADATALREAMLESEKRTAQLKDKALGQMTEPASIDVQLTDGAIAVGHN